MNERWQMRCSPRSQSVYSPKSQHSAKHAGKQQQQTVFDKEMASQPGMRSAQGRTDCQFALAREKPREQQISHVRATNQQQKDGGGHEHPRWAIKHSQELVFEGPRDQAESSERIWICFCKLVRQRRKISSCIGHT
jgi:hypothetical protein